MSDVEKAYSDEIIERGKGSLAIKLPLALRLRFNLKKGDSVDYFIEGETLILKFRRKRAKAEKADGDF